MRGRFLTLLSVGCSFSTLQVQEVEALGQLWGDLKPTSFDKGDNIDVHVGQLWSLVVGTLPYDFYTLNWCDSVAGHIYNESKFKEKQKRERNGKINDYGVNDKIHESPYEYTVGENKDAIVACRRLLSMD